MLVDAEAKGRVRKVGLVPVSAAIAALTSFGRTDATTAILNALKSLPKRWAIEIQKEVNELNDEYNSDLEVELKQLDKNPESIADMEDEGMEKEEIDLATELLLTPLPHAESKEEVAKCQNMALSPVPKALDDEFKAFEQYRGAEFCRHRASSQVVSTTIEGDRSNALRWLGFVCREYEQRPTLKLFASARVSEWTEAWVTKLRELGLKASTLSVYINGVLSMAHYAVTLVEHPQLCPAEELVNLRRQAESISKNERLFETRSKTWISWEAANEGRVKCIEKYNACTDRMQKQALLRDCLIMAFHTLQAPDRVGVVRRLRLGYPGGSLYKKPGESTYTVDISKMRHKTSRFYGPQISTLPLSIQPFVEAFEESLVFEPVGDNPYLFHTSSYQYGQSSSGFCQLVKACFQRHTGIACPPKQLRASFCTFLRSSDGIDEELKESCAHAMKHRVATGGSDNCTLPPPPPSPHASSEDRPVASRR
jgi:hypothetical protein